MSALQKCISLFLKTAVPHTNLLSQSTKLVVGVSGGPDSLALLHALTQEVESARLVVAHLNHGYRETAVAEAALVQNLAERWGLVCETRIVNVAQLAEKSGDSLEEAGRKVRYDFFCKVAKAYETPFILVGHHGDDQAETVLMNLLRGSGVRGLRGMLPVADLETRGRKYFVLRPFLSISRQEIEAYCQAHDLSPVFDESNEDISFFRNRIRQELLPLLEDYNAGIRSHLQQLAELSAADVALLDDFVAKTWPKVLLEANELAIVLNRAVWNDLALGLRRLILRRAVMEKRPFLQDMTFQAIEQARLVAEKKETGQRYNLPGDLILIVDYERLIVTDDPQIILDDWPQVVDGKRIKLSIPGIAELANGWKIETNWAKEVDLAAIQAAPDTWRVFVRVPGRQKLWVRTRQPGERFQPLGLNGRSAKVKDVMINRKIGVRWRNKWPIVATDTQLVWLVGHIIDESVKISEETTSIVQIHCYKG